jgi:hypothetical protein
LISPVVAPEQIPLQNLDLLVELNFFFEQVSDFLFNVQTQILLGVTVSAFALGHVTAQVKIVARKNQLHKLLVVEVGVFVLIEVLDHSLAVTL